MLEAEIQMGICQWLAFALPANALVHHSPNEGRHSVQYRVKQKRLGMTPGWPDLEIFVPAAAWFNPPAWAPIFFEVKTAKGVISKNQSSVIKSLAAVGCHASVVRSIDEAEAVLADLVKLNVS